MQDVEASKEMPKILLIGICVLSFTACTNVQPWERGYLAKTEMEFTPDPLEAKMQEHIYFSKEASALGATVSGGGCGCN